MIKKMDRQHKIEKKTYLWLQINGCTIGHCETDRKPCVEKKKNH